MGVEEARIEDFLPLPRNQYSRAFIDANRVILLGENEEEAVIGTADPDVVPAVEAGLAIRHRGKRLRYLKVDPERLMELLTRRLFAESEGAPGDSGESVRANRIDACEDDAPVVNLLNSIFLEALRSGSSDLHIESAGERLSVRHRIDGSLRPSFTVGKEHAAAVSARIKLMADMNILERRLPQDGRLTATVGKERLDFRVSAIPSIEGESIVLRAFRREKARIGASDTGFFEEDLSLLRAAVREKDGLVLATGPTGSGKTTTLVSLLRELDPGSQKIVSIEDPVENRISGAVQIQVNQEIGLTFSEALKRVFRHDPDVIFIGEIRDPESAELAVRAALTGHLVLSTLHTSDAAASVSRLRNLGIEPYLIAAVLRAVIAQRLVRRICPRCSAPSPTGKAEADLFRKYGIEPPDRLPRPRGCPECGGSGYRGRMAVAEILRNDDGLEELIHRGAKASELEERMRAAGFKPLARDALAKAALGLTSLSEVEREVGAL